NKDSSGTLAGSGVFPRRTPVPRNGSMRARARSAVLVKHCCREVRGGNAVRDCAPVTRPGVGCAAAFALVVRQRIGANMRRFNFATLQAGVVLAGLVMVGAGCFDSATNPVNEGPTAYKDGIKPPPPAPPPPAVDPCAASLTAGGVGPFNAILLGAVKRFDP